MMIPNQVLMRGLARERHARLRAAAIGRRHADRSRASSPMRVRVGHLLISAGAALSGERLERRPSRRAHGHPA